MDKLHEWFEENKREFPWRQSPSPYQVWISEVMLQQTRASVVTSYFEKWLKLFPDIETLAAAPLEKVIKAWEGLGYYSRARNIHKGAQYIVDKFGGELPAVQKDLEGVPGLGPYTVGAILSFGFHQRAAAVDGNVARVLSRYFLIEENISKAKVRRKLIEMTESLLDRERPWVSMEALIELGASLCAPKPHCLGCPLQPNCLGFKSGRAGLLPIKNVVKPITSLWRLVVIVSAEGKVLVQKGGAGQVMADLYEFPYFEMDKDVWSVKKIARTMRDQFDLVVKIKERLPMITHSFTRYKASLYPFRCEVDASIDIDGYEWVLSSDLYKLPFSAGHRRLIT